MNTILRVARNFLSFKYQPKEKKQSKVDRLSKMIREKTGISKSLSLDIAGAVVRGRDVTRLTLQKGWPIDEDTIEGPKGKLAVSDLRETL